MADRFEDLRTLLTAVSTGGVSAAAAKLGIAKSAVSRRLSDLEKRLGVELIDRTRRRLALTETGAEYARRARIVLASLDQLDASVAPAGKRVTITVRASTTLLTHAVIPALAIARTAIDGDDVQLRLSVSEAGEADGDDILVVEDHEGDRGRRLFADGLVICASPAHLAAWGMPGEPKHLDHHPTIAIVGEADGWDLADGAHPFGAVAVTTADAEAAAAAATAGLGIAQLPNHLVAVALSDGRLVRVMADYEPAPKWVVLTTAPDMDERTRRLADALVGVFEGRMHGGGHVPSGFTEGT